jgi:deoxyribonuclease-4
MKDLGSRVDRHAPIGLGKIGSESFRFLMKHNNLPKYLETPDGPPGWKTEIATLWKYAEEKN